MFSFQKNKPSRKENALREQLLALVSKHSGIPTRKIPQSVNFDNFLEQDIELEFLPSIVEELKKTYSLSDWETADWVLASNIDELCDLILFWIPFIRRQSSLKFSIYLDETVYRYHPRMFFLVKAPEDLFRVFEDGPWRWEAQCRFAGSYQMTGHYFGLNEEAARSETIFYSGSGEIPEESGMLALNLRVDNILDLTVRENLLEVAKLCIDDKTDTLCRDPYNILRLLIDDYPEIRGKGGHGITDYIGWWAFNNGYNGVLYFGARAVTEEQRISIRFPTRHFDFWGEDSGLFESLSQNRSHFCLTVFSGAVLLQSMRKCKYRNGRWIHNPFFGTGVDTLIDSGFQWNDPREQNDGYFLSRPKVFPE